MTISFIVSFVLLCLILIPLAVWVWWHVSKGL